MKDLLKRQLAANELGLQYLQPFQSKDFKELMASISQLNYDLQNEIYKKPLDNNSITKAFHDYYGTNTIGFNAWFNGVEFAEKYYGITK